MVIFGSFICLLLEINYFVLALVRPIKLFRYTMSCDIVHNSELDACYHACTTKIKLY